MKHAYMIIAHNEFDILEKQLRLLDDPRNDFYIHIDKKVKDFPFDTFHRFLKHSKVRYVQRQDIRWGDFSQIQCELTLLKAATKGNYDYYHLLSGVDLPLKSNDEIDAFFAANAGKEFVHFCNIEEKHHLSDRIDRFHWMRLGNTKLHRVARRVLDIVSRNLYKLGYRRNRDIVPKLGFGANWFSITHELAGYVLCQEKWIKGHFRWTACTDELFLQTIIVNTEQEHRLYWPQKDNDYRANMRMIDWSRGNGANPWTYRMEDYEMLIDAPFLWARKFSTRVDRQIIDAVYHYVLTKNMK